VSEDKVNITRKKLNNDPQNITQKIKDRVTRTPLKIGRELMCSGRVSGFCITNGTCPVNLLQEKLENTK
jgi:hypothetical protein